MTKRERRQWRWLVVLSLVMGSVVAASQWSVSALADRYPITDLGALPGGSRSEAYGVNGLSHVGGRADTVGGSYHAFLWSSGGSMIDLRTLGGGELLSWHQ